jgi:hypothetical protein
VKLRPYRPSFVGTAAASQWAPPSVVRSRVPEFPAIQPFWPSAEKITAFRKLRVGTWAFRRHVAPPSLLS